MRFSKIATVTFEMLQSLNLKDVCYWPILPLTCWDVFRWSPVSGSLVTLPKYITGKHSHDTHFWYRPVAANWKW